MKWKKTLTIALVLTMVLAGATAVMAFKGGHRGPARFGSMVPGLKCINGLELTEEQKGEIAAILDAHQEEMTPAVDALLVAKQALAEEIWVCDDTADVGAAYNKVAAAEELVVLLQAKINCEVKAVLTEDQILELEECRAQRIERMRERREAMQTKLDEWIDSYLTM